MPKIVFGVLGLAVAIVAVSELSPKPRKSVAVADGIELLPTKEEVDQIVEEAMGHPAVEQSLGRRVSPSSRGIQANLAATIADGIVSQRIKSKTRHLPFGTNLEFIGNTDDGRTSADKGSNPMKIVRVLDGKQSGRKGRVAFSPESFAPERPEAQRRADLEQQGREEAARRAADKERKAIDQAEQERAARSAAAAEKASEIARERREFEIRAREEARAQAESMAEQTRLQIAEESAKAESIFYTESGLPRVEQRSIEQIAALFRHRAEVLEALRKVRARFEATEGRAKK